jgi:hypothetical protein
MSQFGLRRLSPQLRSRLIWASFTTAAANVRAHASAAPGKRRGWNILGLLGHLTMTTAGVSFASISSTVIVSVPVIWLLARQLGTLGIHSLVVDSRPGRCSSTGRALD